MASPLS